MSQIRDVSCGMRVSHNIVVPQLIRNRVVPVVANVFSRRGFVLWFHACAQDMTDRAVPYRMKSSMIRTELVSQSPNIRRNV